MGIIIIPDLATVLDIPTKENEGPLDFVRRHSFPDEVAIRFESIRQIIADVSQSDDKTIYRVIVSSLNEYDTKGNVELANFLDKNDAYVFIRSLIRGYCTYLRFSDIELKWMIHRDKKLKPDPYLDRLSLTHGQARAIVLH